MAHRAEAVDIWRTLMETTAEDPLPDLAPLLQRPEWMDAALCVDLDDAAAVFFPGRGESLDTARAICATCPVHAACLRHALDDPDLDGIWGGTTAAERRQIRRSAA